MKLLTTTIAPSRRMGFKVASFVAAYLLTRLMPPVESFLIQPPVTTTTTITSPMVYGHGASSGTHGCSSPLFGAFDDLEGELSKEDIDALTVPQLKQQLRLRNLKVSGNKQELKTRLADFLRVVQQSMTDDSSSNEVIPDMLSESDSIKAQSAGKKSKAVQEAEALGKEFIDVEAFVDETDKGKQVKSSVPPEAKPVDTADNAVSSNPEVWGTEARIVDDFEGRSPVVDAMSRTVVEFRGSNKTMVQAYVVASRDALRPFLAGGRNRTGDPEERLREIQVKREQAAKRPVKFEEDEGIDEGDETGLYADILHRDFTDWGKYTLTGAQLSAQEVQGVILLSDVYGAFTDDTKFLAEKIAFECQPVVVMVPDLFRGNPWKEDPTTPGFNEESQDYEEWRAQHSDVRVSIDIRASAAVLREQFGVSSVVVWGTCYGGGRALEVAAGYLPNGQISDIDGTVGPVLVEPEVAIAWYPTRYDAKSLFGEEEKRASSLGDKTREMAVMAVFAGDDELEGATSEDAKQLKELLQIDPRVKDYMVKVFPNQDHGFAHQDRGQKLRDETEFERFTDEEFGGAGRLSIGSDDAEVACLLSTAFMETYSRMFLPTTGAPISKDELASEWNQDLEMKDLRETKRDIREEIEASLENFTEEPLGGYRVDPTDASQRDELARLLRTMEPKDVSPDLKIEDDDDLETIYAKLKASDDSFQIF